MSPTPRILVTGAAGQIGSALTRKAALRDVQPIVTSRSRLDLVDRDLVAQACEEIDPDVIVNAAAFTAVDAAEKHLRLAFAANAHGPAHLAEWCAARGRPLVHLSTDYVFSGAADRPYREDDPIEPLNVYGRSKAAGEARIRWSGAPHVILRTAWVYAAEGRNFLRTMLGLGREREELRVVDDQRGAPTSADDIADAILSIVARLLSSDPAYGTYHFTSAGETTWHGFAELIFDRVAPSWGRRPRVVPIPTFEYPTSARRPGYSVLDTSLFSRTFGVVPPAWQDSARQTLDQILRTRS